MSGPQYFEHDPTPEWDGIKERRKGRRHVAPSDPRPRRHGRLLLAYLLFLWLLEPIGIGHLVTNSAESIVGGMTKAADVAGDKVASAEDNMMAIQTMIEDFMR